MAKFSPFDTLSTRYDEWFERNAHAYRAELTALQTLLPGTGTGVEIGVGSGRFAAALGVAFGIDPSVAMLRCAAARGVTGVQGVAEALPFADHRFDYVLMVTVLCFVTSPPQALREVKRVLKPDGILVLDFIDRDSALGQQYAQRKDDSDFYRDATFYSAADVTQLLMQAGFSPQAWVQTLCASPVTGQAIELARTGHGEGAFVVVKACPTVHQ